MRRLRICSGMVWYKVNYYEQLAIKITIKLNLMLKRDKDERFERAKIDNVAKT